MRIGARALRIRASVFVLVGAVAVVSCGGSIVSTPQGAPSFDAPAVGGISATFNTTGSLPSGSTVSSATVAPSGVPAPSSVVRRPESITGATTFYYVSVNLAQAIPAGFITGIKLVLSTALLAKAAYYVEIDDPSATPAKLVTLPGTLSGGIVTFGAGLPALAANHLYVSQFYDVSATTPSPSPSPSASPTPSPSPSPSASPTPSPSPSPSASPMPSPSFSPTASPTPTPGPLAVSSTSVSITGIGSAYAATLQVQETGYAGSFTVGGTCNGIATITLSSGMGPSASYAVTGVAVGSCSATFSDGNGQNVSAPVTVTTLNIPVQ